VQIVTNELDDAIYNRICSLCEQGDAGLRAGKLLDAQGKYNEAWALLPDPKEEWEAATWIQTALGDLHFAEGQFDRALVALGIAIRCPGGLGNPFIHLRLGESAFELGNMKRADDELARAYMGAGRDIFKAENPKYFRRLQGILKPPPGSDAL
jgi:tetratricopeptide (TPR) repeat protein